MGVWLSHWKAVTYTALTVGRPNDQASPRDERLNGESFYTLKEDQGAAIS